MKLEIKQDSRGKTIGICRIDIFAIAQIDAASAIRKLKNRIANIEELNAHWMDEDEKESVKNAKKADEYLLEE